MLKMFGWVLTVWGVYAGLSAYMAGSYLIAVVSFIMSALIMLTNIGTKSSIKVYTAMLCVRDEDSIYQFPVAVANSLPIAGALIKMEALARMNKEKQDQDFTTADDFYIVQERELNSARILQEFSFTSKGDFISE